MTPTDFAESCYHEAIDQAGDYASIEAALVAYLDNLTDSGEGWGWDHATHEATYLRFRALADATHPGWDD